jgi:hypothetical protein
MKHLQTFESFLRESQNTDLYSDETFEYFLQLAEGVQPDSKDDMRISDIVKKSAGNETKEISLAQQMAKSIKDGEKALRRARAAFAKGLSHIAKPFYDKAKDLGYSYHFSDAELQIENLELSEGRSINRIQDEWTKHTSKMKETAAEWKESSGKTKDSLLAKLKEMTQKKKEIEKELYDAISFQDKDLELALESLDLDEGLSPEDKRALRGEMILGQRSDEKAEDLKEVIGKEFSDNFSSTLRSKLIDVKKGPKGWYAVVQEVPSPYSSVKNKPKAGTREDHIFRVWNSFFF